MNKQVWVSPTPGGGWKVHKPGAKRASVCKTTKADALNSAREIAKNNKSELIAQKKNGQIHIRNSYGRDPFPPRG